jgi:hypothetical protein
MEVQSGVFGGERIKRSAEISDCGRYRWWLRRSWQAGNGKTVCFIMLNPSTADAMIDDPTIRRCIGFVKSWGYSTLDVRNLFPLRATNPKELLTKIDDPFGGQRGINEVMAARTGDLIITAWGAFVPYERDRAVLELMGGTPLHHLGLTKHCKPRHPLYVRGDQEPILWNHRKEELTCE